MIKNVIRGKWDFNVRTTLKGSKCCNVVVPLFLKLKVILYGLVPNEFSSLVSSNFGLEKIKSEPGESFLIGYLSSRHAGIYRKLFLIFYDFYDFIIFKIL